MNKTESKILKINDLLIFSNDAKLKNKNIVFTNGCFDILHIGHIDYLEKASFEGDYLIVGLNSDNSVKRLKGEKRPINNQEVRGKMLAALSFVSKVIIFEEDTPYELINTLKPNVLVKGNDYLAENIVGADVVIQNGGKVITIPLVEGFSTTSLIEKIKKL